ncbi:hypothetical protein [Nocardioides sp. Soil796]|uniref:hypothetical protein n=1 Tax=Nocardioides sp. Soil796 TaxID=1736412 RepID=UPI000B0D0F74|nr:hypothetical protein [Nocardioides sp. Soil796]
MSEQVIRPDVRLEDGPMWPVACRSCSALVEVRKSSWEQTSIQWHSDGLRVCEERSATGWTEDGRLFGGCARLGDSIRAAVSNGDLPIQSSDPMPVNTDPDSGPSGHGIGH